MNKKLLIITDYKGNFYCHHRTTTMNVKKMSNLFKKYYDNVKVMKYNELYDCLSEIKKYDIIYTSIENAPKYKDMILEIVNVLSKNNNVYPKTDILLAHDNKIYQEYIKEVNEIKSIPAISINNFLEFIDVSVEFPCVLKNITGSGSRNVFIINSKSDAFKIKKQELIKNIKYNINMRKSFSYKMKALVLIILLNILPSKVGYKIFTKKCTSIPLNDCRFLLQKFIPNQTCDYKVLVYNDKYFAIKRDVRKNDFRASGSGIISNCEIPDYALHALKKVYDKLDNPIISFDIILDDKNRIINIIEWQGIHHGPATVEIAKKYYQFDGKKFVEKDNNYNIEDLYVDTYASYIKRQNK